MTDRERLLDKLRPVLFATACWMLSSISNAEDVVQEALLRLPQALQAGEQDAAGGDIPDSAASRRGMLPALAGLVVGLAYAAISVYWAVGGRWLLNTVGTSLSQPGQARHLAALLAVWAAAGVKAVAALLPLLAVGVWPRTANGGLRRLVRVLTWVEAAILAAMVWS